MSTEETPSVRLRSIYVSPPAAPFPCGSEAQVGVAATSKVAHQSHTSVSITDQFSDEKEPNVDGTCPPALTDPLQLPESTHSLLFMESVFSLPYWFAIAICFISFGCLWLAFENNLSGGTPGNPFSIPTNVTSSVRVAQYLSILVALLMEEEIPTGLYLLRQIQKEDFEKKLPKKRYWKFVFAALIRILFGYAFLLNVFLVLVQATGVIDIFYDVLALQFVQQLDDIAFSLAKMDVLGHRMQRACISCGYHVEFEKQKARCRKSEAFLKLLYFFNFGAFLAGMIAVTVGQINGQYQCNSITVDFNGDEVWQPAHALNQETNEWEDWTLVYSYFSGVYESTSKSHGRPVYQERRKYDRTPFEVLVPAEIRYCEPIKAWIFTHKYIRKSQGDESGCNWILRSPETEEFDLMNVPSNWQIWTGVISTTEVFVSCNSCSASTDCNLNGQCVDGHCQCDKTSGAQYLGMHCETKLSNECRSVLAEEDNTTFSIDYYSSSNGDGSMSMFQEYSRPVYVYVAGTGDVPEDKEWTEDDNMWLVYTGSRWFGTVFNLEDHDLTRQELREQTKEFHAFWARAYSTYTSYVSDPTKASSPVGVDWYEIEGRGNSQFGPFGNLRPIQLYNQTGRGFFRCAGDYIAPTTIQGSDE